MAKRRGAGNIIDLGNDKYRLRYRGQSINITATSPRDLNKQLSGFISEVDKGQTQCKFTFKEFSQKWLVEYAEKFLEVKTIFRYKEILENYIYPEIGSKKLEKITGLDLTEFYNKLRVSGGKRKKGLAESSVKLTHKLISTIFKTAITWKIFRDISSCSGIKFPKQKKQEAPKFYNESQIKEVYKALESEELVNRAAVSLAFDSGFRAGEMGGLTWKDIDFKNRTVNVDKVTVYVPDGKKTREKDSTKNESSTRKIKISESTINLLSEYKKDLQNKGFACTDSMHLFIKLNGEPKNPYWLSVWFPAFLKRHNLPHLNLHGCRHSHASLLIGKGASYQSVADRLGHKNTIMLQKVYVHDDGKNDDILAGMFEELHQTV